MIPSGIMKAGKYTGIRVTPEGVEMARSLVEHIAQHGWTSLGLPLKDPPTLTNVVEEGLKLLVQRKHGGKKK